MENFPEITVISIASTAKDIALKALHFVGDAIRHETPSEHFVQDPLLTPDPVDYDNGRDPFYEV